MSLTKDTIHTTLTQVQHPVMNANILAAGAVGKVAACDGNVAITLLGGGLSDGQRNELKRRVEGVLKDSAARHGWNLTELHIDFSSESPRSAKSAGGAAGSGSQQAAPASNALPDVGTIIAVGAGKGGVGKSTVSVNLAVGLARAGCAVGLMDGDIYGPSMPTMLGLESLETVLIGNMIQPFLVHGVKAMTIGKLVDPEKPLIWRGPMAHGAFKQLVEQTQWGPLDYLIIDLPPGTGDVSLTMAQMMRLTGAVVVCTPQRVAQDDAVRAARMFQQLNIDVLGVVENMSFFIGDDGKEYDLFGKGGAERMAQRLGVPFLGAIPINTALRRNSDSGNPTANFDRRAGGGALAGSLERMVDSVRQQAGLAGMRNGTRMPTLTIS